MRVCDGFGLGFRHPVSWPRSPEEWPDSPETHSTHIWMLDIKHQGADLLTTSIPGENQRSVGSKTTNGANYLYLSITRIDQRFSRAVSLTKWSVCTNASVLSTSHSFRICELDLDIVISICNAFQSACFHVHVGWNIDRVKQLGGQPQIVVQGEEGHSLQTDHHDLYKTHTVKINIQHTKAV